MKPLEYDIVVIGAGPAGSRTAAGVAGANMQVYKIGRVGSLAKLSTAN